MSDSLGLDTIRGARFRAQRLRDARPFYGWIENLKGTMLSVTIHGKHDLEVNDALQFEIEGKQASVTLRAVMRHPAIQNFGEFTIVEQARKTAASKAPRVRVPHMTVLMEVDGSEVCGRVMDLSINGAGIEVPVALERGANLTATFEHDAKRASCPVEVRYCRPEPDGTFRVGLQIGDMSRIESARWMMLFDRVA